MTAGWQTIATLAIVLMATAYLVRRGWRSIVKKRSGGCGACGSCSASNRPQSLGSGSTAEAGKPLVQLQMLAKPEPKSS
ncbi:MAG TPA: FeoB-associated Cys-rich membrane protein [Pirellulales bacterium]|jgi:hypothetical protein|nr:FeoB-associated Cys-rich membrane protein [Pirellulales bacterium]